MKRVALSRGLAGLFKVDELVRQVKCSRVESSTTKGSRIPGSPVRKLPLTGPSVDAAYRGLRGDDVKDARLGKGPNYVV